MKISPAVLSILLRGSSAFISSSSSSSGGLGLASSVISPRSRLNNFSSLANNLRGGGSSIINISSSNSVAPSASTTSLTMVAGGDQQPPLRPFNTWTFDKHCESMSWSPPSDIALTATHCSSSSTSAASLEQADLIIVGVFAPAKDDDTKEEDENEEEEEAIVPPIVFSGKAKELDEALGGALSELAAENSKAFQNGSNAGKMTPVARIRGDGGVTRRFALLGLGHESTKKKEEEENVKDSAVADAAAAAALVTKAASAVASSCHDQKKATTCHVLLPLSSPLTNNNGEEERALLQTFSTEFHSNLYSDNRYRTGKKIEVKAEDVKSVKLFLESSSSTSSEDILASSIATGIQIASGISLTRDIVNAPHNVLNSESLAETARRIALESGGSIKCEILEKEECEARGMGAYLGVARGSETEPQFIHLTYKPASGSIKKKVGIVGKGLLFDTGGYNIKTSMMELMKFDCGGAAAVLGAARAIGSTKPEGVEAHFIVAACENMINARAIVPSDILTASNGKTIEIMNTDAEGRLTLADALVFADKECGCESIIELSTLTGACMISLGKKICGLWTDNDDLAKEIDDISKTTGDKSWRMPMAKEYAESLKSKIADISNLGDRYGGAITAALFLTEFVDKKKPFAHIDIAGPVWDDKSGATGFGAKLVTEWVRKQGE